MEELFYTIDEKYLCAADEICCTNFAKAKIMLEQILDEEPAYAKAHYQLGRIYYYELGEYTKAQAHFEMAIGFSPDLSWTYQTYLELLVHLGKKEQALLLAERALKVNGTCSACISNCTGMLHEKSADLKEAIQYYKKALYHATSSCCENDFTSNLQRAERKLKSQKNYLYV
jgi:tetratricopeptide (TPR) repeat protein